MSTGVIEIGDHTQSAEFRAARAVYEIYLHIEQESMVRNGHHDGCEQDAAWNDYEEARVAAGLPHDAAARYGWREQADPENVPLHFIG